MKAVARQILVRYLGSPKMTPKYKSEIEISFTSAVTNTLIDIHIKNIKARIQQ